VRSLKSGGDGASGAPLAGSAEVNLHLPALLPSDYVSDVQTRLGLYKRIAAAADSQALDDLQAEVGDRFGNLTTAAAQLFHNARLTQQCRALGLRRLDVSAQSSYLVFEEKNSVDPGAVIRLLQKEPRVYRMEGPLKLRIVRGAEPAARFEFAQRLLAALR